jgi:hypothetical protein
MWIRGRARKEIIVAMAPSSKLASDNSPPERKLARAKSVLQIRYNQKFRTFGGAMHQYFALRKGRLGIDKA